MPIITQRKVTYAPIGCDLAAGQIWSTEYIIKYGELIPAGTIIIAKTGDWYEKTESGHWKDRAGDETDLLNLFSGVFEIARIGPTGKYEERNFKGRKFHEPALFKKGIREGDTIPVALTKNLPDGSIVYSETEGYFITIDGDLDEMTTCAVAPEGFELEDVKVLYLAGDE